MNRPRRHRFAAVLAAALGAATSAPAPAGTLLVANKSDHTIDLLEPESGRSLATLPTGQGPHEVAASPDGRTAVVSNYGDRAAAGSTLTVVDVAAAEILRTIDLGRHSRPHGMAWLDATRLAVTTEGSAHLLIVDVARGEVAGQVETAQEISHMVAVAAGARRAFVANIGSGSVSVIDLEAMAKLRDVATGEGAEGIAVSPDGREVWVGNRGADTLTVLDPQTLEVEATIPCPGFPIRVVFTPDGSRVLVSAARSGEVVVFDAEARRQLVRRKLDLRNAPDAARRLFGDRFGDSPVPVGLVAAPSGGTVWVAATQADVVLAVDSRTLEVRGVLEAGREPDGMAYSAVSPRPRAAD